MAVPVVIAINVGSAPGEVALVCSDQRQWFKIDLLPEQADHLAQSLLSAAADARRQSTIGVAQLERLANDPRQHRSE